MRAAILGVAALAAAAGNPVVRLLLSRVDSHRAPARQGELLRVQRELPGGRWIGILERLAVYACLVCHFPMGVGMVLAVKGLGRYPELRAEHEGADAARVGELFIIGTLASMLWAGVWAGLAFWLLGLLV